jgi:hypothetical protein
MDAMERDRWKEWGPKPPPSLDHLFSSLLKEIIK